MDSGRSDTDESGDSSVYGIAHSDGLLEPQPAVAALPATQPAPLELPAQARHPDAGLAASKTAFELVSAALGFLLVADGRESQVEGEEQLMTKVERKVSVKVASCSDVPSAGGHRV